MTFEGGPDKAPPPVAAVVSRSSLMLERISLPLEEAGFEVARIHGIKAFLKHPRQRPFVICFIDKRGLNGAKITAACKSARPGERYVAIRDAWNSNGKSGDRGLFGSLCEAFGEDELVGWALRAADEERQAHTAPPLEELLYDRFRDFLHHLGPASMKDLHKLISERVERPLFCAVMEWSKGNQTKASDVLGIHRNTLRAKLKALGLSGKSGKHQDD